VERKETAEIMKKPNQLIIIGGGKSIARIRINRLKHTLKGRLTCGINSVYKYINTTYLVCMNYTDFYDTNRTELTKLPLIVSCKRPHSSIWEKNTVLVDRNYRLSGILAIDVGLSILEEGEIFLLGFDYHGSHFYNDIGNSYYNRGFGERDFGEFRNSKIKIYNVSINSNLNMFPKISYNEFFKKLDNNNKYNQEELANYIKRRIL